MTKSYTGKNKYSFSAVWNNSKAIEGYAYNGQIYFGNTPPIEDLDGELPVPVRMIFRKYPLPGTLSGPIKFHIDGYIEYDEFIPIIEFEDLIDL